MEGRAGELGADILQQEGHAAEGTIGQRARCLTPGSREELVDHRVELGIELLDPGDRRIDELGG